MALPGCTVGPHTQEKPKATPPTSGGTASTSNLSIKMESTADGRETYSTTKVKDTPQVVTSQPPPVVQEEEDDTSIPVPVDTPCRRSGCSARFVSEEISRRGEGVGTVCKYHPAPPIFREGSKGYLCCKRRVLEFEEFLKIEGCKTGKHLFAPKPKAGEEFVACRIDHYQTPTQVHVSIFAKQTDKNASTIRIERESVHVDLVMPNAKRFQQTLDLYGPIDPTASKHMFLGTKVELILAKADTRSWTFLEKTTHSSADGYNLTFGVGGRTGTVGGKQLVLSEDNKLRSS